MKTIGSLHRTYYNKKAFKFAFESFRSAFPNAPYVIISDNGDDFSEYVNENTYFIKSDVRNYGTGPNSVWYDKWEIIFDYYYRIKQSCEIVKTDYIILMEDDVLIKNSINIDDDFDLCGPCKARLSKHMIDFIRSHIKTNEKEFFYGFSGGAILNCKSFLDNYEKILENVKNYHIKYSNDLSEQIAMAGDGNLTFHFYLLGLKYSCSKWLKNGTITHPFKKYYE